jgi:hypothetical protein
MTDTCATCMHIGVAYWDNGFTISHHCLKGDIRRAETMPKDADLFAHFRAFFDASASQKACKHYDERPPASADVMALLERIGSEGRAEVKFWSDESRLAHSLEGKFVKLDQYAKAPNGYRVYRLLPVGEVERARAAVTAQEPSHG